MLVEAVSQPVSRFCRASNRFIVGRERSSDSEEVLLIAKTASAKFEDLEREVRAIHSYETPEIVAVPLINGSAPYLEWLKASVIDRPGAARD